MTLRPFRNYQGFEHVLGGAITFVHPTTRNLYFCACEKRNSIGQDFAVYRLRPGAPALEEVKRYVGGVDAVSQFTMGSAAIDTFGALITASASAPKDRKLTTTGFEAQWDWIPGIDDPWLGVSPGIEDLRAEIDELRAHNIAQQQQLTAIETALGTISGEGLSTADREALNRLKVFLTIEG